MDRSKDKWNAVYITFYFLGLGTLLPWNFFYTANDYWMYKLEENEEAAATTASPSLQQSSTDANGNSSAADNSTGPELQPVHYNSLQTLFQNALSICAMLPNVIFQFLNTVLQRRISEKLRIVGSLFLMIAVFVLTTVLVKVDTGEWRDLFFAVTMASIVLLNSCSAVFQSSMFGLAACLPPRYIQSLMAGQGIGGVFAALAMIATLGVSSNPAASAFVYFSTATVVIALTVLCYLTLGKNEFYRACRDKNQLSKADDDGGVSMKASSDSESGPLKAESSFKRADTFDDGVGDSTRLTGDGKQKPRPSSLGRVFAKTRFHCCCVAFTFFVTLACFPAVAASVRSTRAGTTWGDVYFTPVCCFLLFNVTDWIGRSLPARLNFPAERQRFALGALVLSRAAFPFLFALCNAQPRHIPLVFAGDAYYVAFMSLFGLSNGYLSTLAMKYGPRRVQPRDYSTAGSLLAFAVTVGLAAGAGFSFVVKMMV